MDVVFPLPPTTHLLPVLRSYCEGGSCGVLLPQGDGNTAMRRTHLELQAGPLTALSIRPDHPMATTTLYRHHSNEFPENNFEERSRRRASLPILVPSTKQTSFKFRQGSVSKSKSESKSSLNTISRESSFSERGQEKVNQVKTDSNRKSVDRVTKCLNCQFAVYCPKPHVDPNFCSKDCATCFYWPNSSESLTPLITLKEPHAKLLL